MPEPCTHLDLIKEVRASSNGCAACLQRGDTWVHLRMCLTCGNVGCCDDSLNQHASKHAQTANHPLIQSFEPGERWFYCYIDDVMMESDSLPGQR